MDPQTKERLQTAALYLLFLLVYVIIAGLLGTFAGIIFGSTIDHVLTGTIIGGLIGLGLGAIAAVVGLAVIPPAKTPATPGEGDASPAGDAGAEEPNGSADGPIAERGDHSPEASRPATRPPDPA